MTLPEPDTSLPTPPAADVPPRSRTGLLLSVAALLGLLIGGGAGFVGGFLVARPPAERYTIWVFLKTGAGDGDKAGVRAALERLHPDGAIRFVTKEQAAAKAQETFRDYPDTLKYMTADNLPESFEADLVTRTFTCDGISPIGKMAGVDRLAVGRMYHDKVPGAQLGC